MNSPKLHHFIPRAYQERFVDEAGCLFIYDKKRSHLGVRVAKPTTEFAETHLYSLILKDGSRDPIYETDFFARLDTNANNLIGKIVEQIRAGKAPNLNSEEKKNWDLFFYHQWKRLPDVISKSFSLNNLNEDLPRYITEYEMRYGPASKDEKEILLKPESIKRLKQNAMIEAITDNPTEEVFQILRRKGLAIARINKPSKSFILGDMPFLRMGPRDRTHLSDPMVELWLPIASDIAISPAYNAGTELVIDISDDHVRRINKGIFKQSTKIAACSESLIRSLLTSR